ncbi:MAG: hypothetical protein K2K75_13640 [Muribaculaceae bacterium]|nr:hypothetical protein [Muribaculaceae bacterium]
MSYTRRFSRSVTIRYSGSVSYPASEHGGSVSYSGSASETVHFDVTVDTDPFDAAVDGMKNGVDLLTGSVVATEAAQLGAIDKASRKIGDTIVAGFFKTVRSDISQQITQLKINAEALLLQLNKLAERCREKQKQMGSDYHRIADRYIKIFTDLNTELENRIYSIDEPVFQATRTLDKIGSHTGNEDAAAIVSVTAGENAHVHSILAANLAKRQAVEAIEKGKRFLEVQHATDEVIRKGLLPIGESAPLSTPYCVIETSGEKGSVNREMFISPLLVNIPKDKLNEGIDSKGWNGNISDEDRRNINDYFNQRIALLHQESDSIHDRRVADLTARLFNLSKTAAPGK